MVERLLIWLIVVLVLLGVCWRTPNAARIVLGCFFILMGLGFHIVLVLADPHAYDGYRTTALLPLYRWVFATIVTRLPLLVALVAGGFEIAVGLLMLGKHRAARMGLIAGSLFLLTITPLAVETLPNALLALGLAALATREYPSSVWELLRARFAHPTARTMP